MVACRAGVILHGWPNGNGTIAAFEGKSATTRSIQGFVDDQIVALIHRVRLIGKMSDQVIRVGRRADGVRCRDHVARIEGNARWSRACVVGPFPSASENNGGDDLGDEAIVVGRK